MIQPDPRDNVRKHTARAGFQNGLNESIAAVAWAIVALADAVKEQRTK